MADWKELIPWNERIIFASNGNFGDPGMPKVGMLILSKKKVFVIYSGGIMPDVPRLHRSIPLLKMHNIRVTGSVMMALEFDYEFREKKEHLKFTSFDYEVLKLLEDIEYARDNP
ncbi:MAG: hypothetical protein V1835_03290 [Candidatus Micrarchaeota archaeon]